MENELQKEVDLSLFTDNESYNRALTKLLGDSFKRLKTGLTGNYSPFTLGPWIAEHTWLAGRRFSFVDMEFQRDILACERRDVLVVKCAQVGLSEIFARWALALMCTQRDFTVIWTFPNATDAEEFSKARLSPIISTSSSVRRALSTEVNSVTLRQFGMNNFLYTRGTKSETQALSVPADALIHDEYDRSDMSQISAYRSRLLQKPWKLSRIFSTPTSTGTGILKLAETAERRHQVWTCSHCNHTFVPDYYEHVKVPGYDGPLEEIKLWNLPNFDYQNAKLLCPACGLEPSSELKYRSWIVENNALGESAYEAVAFFVSPFCAPRVRTPAALIKFQTLFSKKSEFDNQALGKSAQDSSESLTDDDIRRAEVTATLDINGMCSMGIDLGAVCHVMIGKEVEGQLVVVYAEKVVFTQLEARKQELSRKFNVVSTVADALPYTDLVARMINYDPRMYAAFYTDKKSTELYNVKEQEAAPEEGKLNIQSVSINREVAFDELMRRFKEGRILLAVGNQFPDVLKHCLDMKRAQEFDRRGSLIYKWRKTQGDDHYHHALNYLQVAVSLQGMSGGMVAGGFSIMGTAQPKEVQVMGYRRKPGSSLLDRL